VFGPFRAGDVRHSQANVDKAERLLGYENTIPLVEGLSKAMPWYIEFVSQR
jgi:UDP-N-acetylglucosamine 4-epimerase